MSLVSTSSVYKFSKSRFITLKPFVLLHQITFKCNLKCKMCNLRKRHSDELKLNQIFKMIDDAKKAGFFLYQVTGGEPLLREDIPIILKYAKANGFLTYMNTNGTLLKKRLREIAPFLDSFSTSIDGTEKSHNEIRGYKNAYEETLEGIAEAKKLGMNLRIISTIGPENIGEMEEVAKTSKKLEVPLIFQVRYMEKGIEFNENELREFTNKIHFLRKKDYLINNSNKGILYLQNYTGLCNYPKIFLRVRPSGEIWSCTGDSFGNVNETSFKNILYSNMFKNFIRKTEACKKFCRLGCITEANPIYDINPAKILSLLKRGIL